MNFLNQMKSETTIARTMNGATTYSSSLNHNVDFFSQVGAMRDRMDDAVSMFALAYSENKEMALRNLVYLRDVRGGLGERDLFRKIVRALADSQPEIVENLLPYVSFLGRWDDLVDIYAYAKKIKDTTISDKAIKIIGQQLISDIDAMVEGKEVSLIGKWLPSPSVRNKERKNQANMLAFDLGMGVSNYRKTLSTLRKYIGIVETKLTERDYDSIDFEKLPSRALFKYRRAFATNMEEKYSEFIDRVNNGEIKANASNVLPYEIVRSYIEGDGWFSTRVADYNKVLEATWKSLDDVIGDIEEDAIVVADTSGSMMGNPWYVAESLAIYCAERLKGAFKNHFITFSDKPKLIELPDDGSLHSKMQEYHRHSIVENTNLQATFDLILETAIKNNTPQNELPKKLIIISDMEFDEATEDYYRFGRERKDATNFEVAKKKFEDAGYELPKIVFWNVNALQENIPVRYNEKGVALVSGLTPNIFKQVLLSETLNPESFMMDVLMNDRYDFIIENVLV